MIDTRPRAVLFNPTHGGNASHHQGREETRKRRENEIRLFESDFIINESRRMLISDAPI